jgi:hypothetical protein
LGVAILVNGYWRKDDPGVIADNHGPAMLRQISAAIQADRVRSASTVPAGV